MFVRNAAAVLFAIGSLSRDALAELITITEYPSTCSAIYTAGTRSVTIVQSTVTVVPVQYGDAAWNSGTPFVLEVGAGPETPPSYAVERRQTYKPEWLTLDGGVTDVPLSAGQYMIRNGQLMSVNGSYLSTDLNVEKKPFSIAPSAGDISTYFSFKEDALNWTSPRFAYGKARFCRAAGKVHARFLGADEPRDVCAPIILRAKPCDGVNPLSSTTATPTGSVSVPTSMSVGSMTSGPPVYSSQSPGPSAGPSASTPPPPYTDPRTSTSRLPSVSVPSAYDGSSSSVPGVLSSTSSRASTTSSAPVVPVPSSSNIPIYPVSGSSSSSSSSSSPLSFASSGSPIGPGPPYVSPTVSTSSSMSMSSGGVRTSESVSSSSSSSPSLRQPSISTSPPPIYTPPTSSSSRSSSTSSSGTPPAIFSPVSSTSSQGPSIYTPPAVSSSSSSSSSSSLSVPPIYTDFYSSSSTSSAGAAPYTTPSSSTSTPASTSPLVVNPPFYTDAPQPCPEGGGTIYQTAAGFAYTIYCAKDSDTQAYRRSEERNFAVCIQQCDFEPQCGAVVQVGGTDCYFKSTPTRIVSPDPNLPSVVLAVRVSGTPPVYDMTTASASSSTPVAIYSPISVSTASSTSEVPPVYVGPTTTTTTTTTSSSSSEVPPVYDGPTTTTTTTTTSSSSSEVPPVYDVPTTTTTTTTTSSSSSEVPPVYDGPTTTTTTTTTSSSSSEVPPVYDQTTTTTTTTSASSSSSSAASSTLPYSSYLVLPSPTPCDFGDPPDYDEDDSYCDLDLPFPMTLYGTTSQRTFASSNGYLSLNRGTSQFQVRQFPYPAIPENSIAPFFDDLMLYGGLNPRQGIYYQIEGGRVTYEYYLGRSAQLEPDKLRLRESLYHFTVEYDSAVPNVFTFTYYSVGLAAQEDEGVNGAYAGVGLQGLSASGQTQSTQFSFREAVITPGTQITCSGVTNSCTRVTPPNRPPLIGINIGG